MEKEFEKKRWEINPETATEKTAFILDKLRRFHEYRNLNPQDTADTIEGPYIRIATLGWSVRQLHLAAENTIALPHDVTQLVDTTVLSYVEKTGSSNTSLFYKDCESLPKHGENHPLATLILDRFNELTQERQSLDSP